MEKIIEAITKALADEDEGVQTYNEMADAFDHMGHSTYANILRDIAAEEAIHAKHLNNILAEIAEG